MSALILTITTAGAQAVAQVGGSVGPVVLSSIQVGTGVWTTPPTGAETALKQSAATLAVVGADVPTPGTIHLTAEDTSGNSYAATEIGIFTNTGILFALYSQTAAQGAVFSKGAGSVALLAVDLVISALPPGSVTATAATFGYPAATTATPGVAELAQASDMTAGADNAKIVTCLLVAEYCAQFAKTANNLSDLQSAATARGNLGLGSAATYPAPSAGNAATNQVVLGSDSRLTDSRNPLPNSVIASSIVGNAVTAPAIAAGAVTAPAIAAGAVTAPAIAAQAVTYAALSSAAIAALLTAINTANYPVGQIYISYLSGDPSTLLSMPGTAWQPFGPGQVLVGISTIDANFATLGQTGGADTVTLASGQIPAHTHPYSIVNTPNSGGTWNTSSGGTAQVITTAANTGNNPGAGGAHNNLQPYIVVYFWKRTA